MLRALSYIVRARAKLLAFPALGAATAILVAWATTIIDAPGSLWCTGVALPQPSAIVRITGPAYTTEVLLRGLDNDPLTQSPALANAAGFTFEGGVSWTGSSSSHTGFRLHDGGRDGAKYIARPVLAPGMTMRATRNAGWPLPSLGSTIVRTDAGLRGRWLLPIAPRWASGPHLFARSLPLRPVWPGFVANTALFAAGWWMLLGLPMVVYNVIRRRGLRRRGRCPRCGYDLSGLNSDVCPECGTRVRAEALTPPPAS